ncbi:RNaseH domain-containing protein [Nocardioides sp. NPDC000445]|uniref:RNaseH domain-containing protein n=1 Tax=Nocardioides sp. NPDC000445 TaxID=3154257 RepID=UPI003325FF4B
MTGSTKTTNDLSTLAYRIEPSSLGAVTVYELDERFQSEWQNLESRVRRDPDSRQAPPYSALADALVAVTSQPVKLFRYTGIEAGDRTKELLITTRPIDPGILENAFSAFESRVRKDDAGKLGRLITEASVHEVELPAIIDAARQGGGDAPRWVNDVAAWSYAAQLASAPLNIDGKAVRFRLDTNGDLLAWDRPILVDTGRPPRRSGIATIYLETRVQRMRGSADLWFTLQPHVARVPRGWFKARHAWVARDEDSPILCLPVDGPWEARGRPDPSYRHHTAAIVQACQIEELPTPPQDPLQGDPDVFRLKGKPSGAYPIGKAVGVRFAFQIRQQVETALGLEALRFARSGLSAGPQVTGRIATADLDTAVLASGVDSIRIVGLYSDLPTRGRMINALRQYAPIETVWGAAKDLVPTALTPRVDVVFEHTPDLVRHGDHSRDLGGLKSLKTSPGQAAIALVETTYPSQAEKNVDAKPRLRRALGELGIVSQFIDADFEAPSPTDNAGEPDHQSIAAVRDLFRAAAVMDRRVPNSLTQKKSGNIALTDPAIFVGLHLRKHTPPKGKGKPAMIIRLVALFASDDPDAPWPLRMYDPQVGAWLLYREGLARYFTQPIGDESITGSYDGLDALRTKIDTALKQLPYDHPIVLFIDPHAGPAENTWRGLKRTDDGSGWLPGRGFEHPDLSIVTVRTSVNALRPTDRGTSPRDPAQPALPGQELYVHHEATAATWILAQKSRAFRGSSPNSRIGAAKTRWADDLPKARMKEDWHLLNAVEIAVPKAGASFLPDQLAVLTARLCHQSVSWDDRTRHPVPLHLAMSAVKDHPRFIPETGADD